jgi:prevent-host-death family protein
MKTMSLSEAKDRFSDVVAVSQGERVLVLKHGKPAALIQGVEGYEIGEILMFADPTFWRWAAERQQGAGEVSRRLSAAAVRRDLLGTAKPASRRRAVKQRKARSRSSRKS